MTSRTVKYYIYILKNPNNEVYIGSTNSVEERVKRHRIGDAAKNTKERKNYTLVYQEEFPTQLEAMRREKQLKGWTRAKKEALITGDLEKLKKL